jgi:ribonuclease P protein component
MKKSLSKSELLRKKSEIKSLFSSKMQYSCKGLKLIVCENSFDFNRILVTPSRAYKTAIERNYTKRVGKEIYRICKQQIVPGYDFAFLFYPGLFTYINRKEQILSLLIKANLIK